MQSAAHMHPGGITPRKRALNLRQFWITWGAGIPASARIPRALAQPIISALRGMSLQGKMGATSGATVNLEFSPPHRAILHPVRSLSRADPDTPDLFQPIRIADPST